MEEEKRDSDYGENVATKECEGKRKANFNVEDVPLHYIREAGSMKTSISSPKAHHFNVCKEAMQF